MLILDKNRTRNMQGSKILLCIGFVYPEPKSSAAGTRILQLLKCFAEANYKVVFGIIIGSGTGGGEGAACGPCQSSPTSRSNRKLRLFSIRMAHNQEPR